MPMTYICLLIGGAVLSFGIGAMAWWSILRCKRQQQTISQLTTTEGLLRRQGSILQLVVENMGEGLGAFDLEGRLLVFNSRFVELLELPPEVMSQNSLHIILEFQMARGDFGP